MQQQRQSKVSSNSLKREASGLVCTVLYSSYKICLPFLSSEMLHDAKSALLSRQKTHRKEQQKHAVTKIT